ncbi:hypothetical protein LMG31506_01337 [Cupriavidus yeoncheonensis]|uniref:Uncharacterized protein n=1 Tax=Cupriavidus yeoncheonensis TaxID=1462994 RepID=A0A916IRH7_9BURK|nr:hypothetical protein [Cupriavidus yeoncheonensis]CAG2134208.1 hypothetical protein LMG31506_01337 [Cupriavidus yeoncheonensis]
MHNKTLNALLLTIATLGASAMAGQAAAQGLQDRGVAGDRYGYVMRQGNPDPYTDGGNAIGKRDPFTDGAHVTDKRDPFTTGGHSAAAGLNLAGMDHTGVSAPPAHGGSRADANA